MYERPEFSANDLKAPQASSFRSGLLEADEKLCVSAKGLKFLFIYLFFLSCMKLNLACVVNPKLRLGNALALTGVICATVTTL